MLLIPVLVTGIKPRRVRAVSDCAGPAFTRFAVARRFPLNVASRGDERVFRAADAALQDSCDEHRNEGEIVAPAAPGRVRRRRGDSGSSDEER